MKRDRKDFLGKGEKDTFYITPGEILGDHGRRESLKVPLEPNIHTLVWSKETQRICPLLSPQ